MNSLEIIALDVRASGDYGLLLLIAAVNVARTPEYRYSIGKYSLNKSIRYVTVLERYQINVALLCLTLIESYFKAWSHNLVRSCTPTETSAAGQSASRSASGNEQVV